MLKSGRLPLHKAGSNLFSAVATLHFSPQQPAHCVCRYLTKQQPISGGRAAPAACYQLHSPPVRLSCRVQSVTIVASRLDSDGIEALSPLPKLIHGFQVSKVVKGKACP